MILIGTYCNYMTRRLMIDGCGCMVLWRFFIVLIVTGLTHHHTESLELYNQSTKSKITRTFLISCYATRPQFIYQYLTSSNATCTKDKDNKGIIGRIKKHHKGGEMDIQWLLAIKLHHERLVEPLQPSYPLNSRRQESSSQMPSSLLLSEPGSWDHTDTSSIEETHAVEFVRLPSFLLGSLNGFLRDGDGREEVHSAERFLAGNATHLAKCFVKCLRALFKALVNV